MFILSRCRTLLQVYPGQEWNLILVLSLLGAEPYSRFILGRNRTLLQVQILGSSRTLLQVYPWQEQTSTTGLSLVGAEPYSRFILGRSRTLLQVYPWQECNLILELSQVEVNLTPGLSLVGVEPYSRFIKLLFQVRSSIKYAGNGFIPCNGFVPTPTGCDFEPYQVNMPRPYQRNKTNLSRRENIYAKYLY